MGLGLKLIRMLLATWVDPPDFSSRSRSKLYATELDTIENDLRFLYNTMNQLVPPGTMIAWGGDDAAVPPSGWLKMDGAGYTTTTHPGLFAVIGYKYGGTGATFYVPDVRGRVLMGAGTGVGGGASGGQGSKPVGGAALAARLVGAWGGAETHVLVQAELAAHSHIINVTQQTRDLNHWHSHQHYHNLENHDHSINHWHFAEIGTDGSATGWARIWNGNAGHDHYAGVGTIAEGPRGQGAEAATPGKDTNVNVDGTANGAPNGANRSSWTTNAQGRAGADGTTTGWGITDRYDPNHNHAVSATSNNNTPAGTAHNNTQPFVVAHGLIKT